MSKILCFGELLLRLSPQLGGEWLKQNNMPVFLGGAELNVARALANWQLPVAYSTALPDHYLSREIFDFLEQSRIDASRIEVTGNRIGTYYLPQGADLKSAGVIYDRDYSSFWELKPGQINWTAVLQDVSWLHFSAISPALNENVAAVCLEAVTVASAKGITVSVDLNYRSKLWQYGKQPDQVMPKLVEHCDVVMGNIWAANTMLGIAIDENIHENSSREKYLAHAKQTSEEIRRRFPKCTVVANTFRFDGKDESMVYYTSLNEGGKQFNSKEYRCNSVVDRSGSGDCYMAGLIYSLSKKREPQEVVEFATAAAFGKLQEKGDATSQTVETILKNSKRGTAHAGA
ncbi:sugar kinase [Flavisolibacter nicotianae]|uniref:sugar kinase n=1 Tax=Flavisolibacter nicotianae TaxID=2364882 RepID=UPI000EB27D8B|nr:sugar kinase [Flavisolibacter nicotianae]